MKCSIASLCLALLAFASSAGAAEPGPVLGSKAPAFELTDQSGDSRSLESLLGPGQLAIVFFRSADW